MLLVVKKHCFIVLLITFFNYLERNIFNVRFFFRILNGIKRRGSLIDIGALAFRKCAWSCHAPFLSLKRRLVATEKLHTWMPDGSARISGSRVRFPITKALFK